MGMHCFSGTPVPSNTVDFIDLGSNIMAIWWSGKVHTSKRGEISQRTLINNVSLDDAWTFASLRFIVMCKQWLHLSGIFFIIRMQCKNYRYGSSSLDEGCWAKWRQKWWTSWLSNLSNKFCYTDRTPMYTMCLVVPHRRCKQWHYAEK